MPTELLSLSPVEATKIELACRAVTRVGEEYSMELNTFAIELRDRLVDETADATPEDLRRYLPFYIQEQFAAFLGEHEQDVPARARDAMREAGLTEAPALNVVARPPAPGLHPYVRPDFLEDSLLLSTFLTVIGLALHPIHVHHDDDGRPYVAYVDSPDARGGRARRPAAGGTGRRDAGGRRIGATDCPGLRDRLRGGPGKRFAAGCDRDAGLTGRYGRRGQPRPPGNALIYA